MSDKPQTLCANCKSFYAVPAHWPCCTHSCARRFRQKRLNGLA